MICTKCQNEIDENDKYCRYCGKLQLHTDDEGENIVLVALRSSFASALFFVVCVLLTVALLCQLATFSFPVITLLFAIFFWMAFSASKKNVLTINHIKRINTITIIQKVLGWVNVGVCSIIIAFLAIFGETVMSFVLRNYKEIETFLTKFPRVFGDLVDSIIILAIIIVGVIMICQIIFNLTYKQKVKKFNKSVLKALQSGSFDEIVKAEAVKIWLYVIAGLLVVFGLRMVTNSIFTTISDLCLAACCILSGLMINSIFISHDELN